MPICKGPRREAAGRPSKRHIGGSFKGSAWGGCAAAHLILEQGRARPRCGAGGGGRVVDIAPMQTAVELEVAKLLVTTLRLEEDPASIEPEIPLFVEGWGVDSIDALERS